MGQTRLRSILCKCCFQLFLYWSMCSSTELFSIPEESLYLYFYLILYILLFSKTSISLAVILVLSLLRIVQASLPYVKIGLATVLQTLIHVCFLTKEGLNV
jgi:hypothetical protein